jgi:hypothetical protein
MSEEMMAMDKLFSEDLMTLSSAFSEQIKTANQTWAFAATMTLLVFTAMPDKETGAVALLGFSMDPIFFYPAGGLLLAALNIAYCSIHLQAQFTLKIFYAWRDSLTTSDIKCNKFSALYTYKDATDSMLKSQSYDRMYPFVRILPYWAKARIYQFLKWIAQLVYTPVPFAGCYWCATHSFTSIQSEWLRYAAIVIVLILPAAATVIMVLTSVGWIVQATESMKE